MNAGKPPLVILVFDSGDIDFILRWTKEGRLPTVASIMERGCWGRIAGSEQICEQGTALSLFSGISRAQHGYYYFRQLKPGTYQLEAAYPRAADTPPFWSYLRGGPKKVAIIDAPETYPVPGLKGIQLAYWAAHQPSILKIAASAEPAGILKEAQRVFGPQIRIEDFQANREFDHDVATYRLLLSRVQKKGALCRHLLSKKHFDLFVIGFSEDHYASHQFWRYRPEARGEGARLCGENELTHAIRNVYQAIDHEMGLLLALLPKEANILILSLYGLEDQFPTTHLIESFCQQLGYQSSANPVSQFSNPRDLLCQMIPISFRRTLSQCLPLSLQEYFFASYLSRNTDWQKTTCFPTPSLYTSFLRVNLKGREPQGIVEKGAAYERLLDRLESDLEQLIDPTTGKPAVAKISRTTRSFKGGPPESLPDLFVEWKQATHFMRRLRHPRTELLQQKPKYFRDSYHSFYGFIAASGPDIRARGSTDDIAILDLAPTLLFLMGESPVGKLSGKVIKEIIQG